MKITIVSDVHINSRYSKSDKLNYLLATLSTDLLILNGDIYDLHLGEPEYSIFEIIKNNRGIKQYIYIPGNHDHNIRDYFPELAIQHSFDMEDIFVKHGHLDNLSERYRPFFFTKYVTIARDYIEKVFKINVRLLLKKMSFGLLSKFLFLANKKAARRYPGKKVIIGHTHLPQNAHPYYNCGCMVDDFLSYMEVTIEGKVSTINLILVEE